MIDDTGIQKYEFNNDGDSIQRDILSCLLWQHNNAKNLTALLTKKAAWYASNYQDFWKNWFNNVFNLFTCNDFGLTVWSIILDLPIQIAEGTDAVNKPLFGLVGSSVQWAQGFGENFNNGNFSMRTGDDLTPQEKRFLLLLQFFKLNSRAAIPAINAYLSKIIYLLSDTGAFFAIDNFDMSMTYFFNFTPRVQLFNALLKYDVLPRPAAVSLQLKQPVTKAVFGFVPKGTQWSYNYGGNFYSSNLG